VLVVSNIDLTIDLPTIKPPKFLESSIKDFTLNISNDYRYLKTGYYVSLHAEILGNPVIPSSENAIDAYRIPILLLRASKAEIPVIPYLVTSSVKQMISEIGFPMVVFAVNPFSYDGFRTAKNRSALYRAVKSLGMNYKFAICVQPLKGEMLSFNSFFGKCEQKENIQKISEKVYETFKIPVCKLHVQTIEDKVYLCGLQPLRKDEISSSGLGMISKGVSQLFKNGDHCIG
jgi:hypothetical protein